MHWQRHGEEHPGTGNGGASSLKKRLLRSRSAAGHALGLPTMATECHGCGIGSGSFAFRTIFRSVFAIFAVTADQGRPHKNSTCNSAFTFEVWHA
jgi:hypothetical protein